VLSRRLLLGGSGGGVYLRSLKALSSSPLGGWTQIQFPKACGYNGYTYLGWLNGSTGQEQVAAFRHSTGVLSTPVTLHASFGVADNHASPACLVMASSHRLLVAYAAHDGANLYTRLSTNDLDSDPTLSGGFDPEVVVLTSGDWTYTNLHQLASGTVFLNYRYVSGPTGYLEYVKSTNEGASWTSQTQIYGGNAGHVPYWRIGHDGTKIHVIITDVEPQTGQTFHFYMLEDGTCHKSDGTLITPLLHASDCTAVLSNSLGANWSWGVAANGLGPACVLMQDQGGTDNAIKTARYRSGAWQVDTVIGSVGGQLNGNQYASGCGILPDNPDVVYLARKIGSHFEQYRYVSGDDGVTWAGTALTSGSTVENIWVDGVRNAEPGLEAVWLKGTYTSDTSYAFGVEGWG
jgi:hypothetical protein